jgi:hypothetical protein
MDSTAADLGAKVKDEITRLRPVLVDLIPKPK